MDSDPFKTQRDAGPEVVSELGAAGFDDAAAQRQLERRALVVERRGFERLPQPLGRRQRLVRRGVAHHHQQRLPADAANAIGLAVLDVLRDESPARAERVQQVFSLDYDAGWEKPKPRF